MTVLEVPAEKARDMVFNDCEDSTLVETKITGHSRWSIHKEAIIKYLDKHWKVAYSVGATESQDERPFEYDKDVKLVEVELVPVKAFRWIEV